MQLKELTPEQQLLIKKPLPAEAVKTPREVEVFEKLDSLRQLIKESQAQEFELSMEHRRLVIDRSPYKVGDKMKLVQQFAKTRRESIVIITRVEISLNEKYEHNYELVELLDGNVLGSPVRLWHVESFELLEKAAFKKEGYHLVPNDSAKFN